MEIERLINLKNKKVLVFGDYMVDKYVFGKVNRISPEAPVPVIEVESEQLKLGGSGNVINNLISLGTNVRVLGCIGYDTPGEFIMNSFINDKIDTNYFKQYSEIKTIQKTRIVSKKQQFMRIDEEIIEELPNDYYIYIKKNINEILSDIDSIIISDYAKGAVNQKFAQLVIQNAKLLNIPIIIDPKGNNYEKYKGATLCTPNMKELQEVTKTKISSEEDIFKYGKNLVQHLDLENLIVTRSEDGMSLITHNTKKDFPAIAKEVIDVSGAGDTVVATIAVLKALDFDIDEICILANLAASVVVSKFGTSTLSLDELVSTIEENPNFKFLELSTVKYIINELKLKNKKIVFTNGCFDLLHVGHIHSFEQAKKMGDILIVAVNSDSSVKENKSDLRPIIPQEDRIKMLCSLDLVDYVILMEDKTPENIISLIQPDICVKGSDWKGKDIPEKKTIDSYGGQLRFVDLEKGKSTTNIINKVIKVYEKK